MLLELIVLGTDPAGVAAARLAAETGHTVAVVSDPEQFSAGPNAAGDWKTAPEIRHFSGSVRFQTPESLEITISGKNHRIEARRFLLACGNRPKRPSHIPFDGQRILDSDEARDRTGLPEPLLVVGAGEHGLSCAAELFEQGYRVSLVDQSLRIDPKAVRKRNHSLARCPVNWGSAVLGVESRKSAVTVFYDNGSIETFGGVVFAVGRLGCTSGLNLPRTDLLLDEANRVWCNESGQTGLPHIYAAGSVVGFPRFPGSPLEEAQHLIMSIFGEAMPPRPRFLRAKKLATRS